MPVALAALALFWNLGAGSLLSSDDAIYAQMAREMVRSGDWLEPTWMGVGLFEKPPLLFWLLGLSGSLFGWTDAAMRLPGVLASILALWCAARIVSAALTHASPFVKRSGPLLVVLLSVGTVAFTMTARRPLTDPLLTAGVLATLWWGTRAVLAPSSRAGLVLGVVAGLGVLAKQLAMGPAILVVALGLLAHRRFRELGLAALAGVVVTAPWHLAMTLRHGAEFWQVYLGYHVGARASGSLIGATDPTYYLQVLAEQDPALALVLGAGLVAALVALRYRPAPERVPLALVTATAWLTLLALQLSGTRLFHYLMPVVPLAAVATVAGLGSWLQRSPTAGGLGVLAALAFVQGPLDPHLMHPDYAGDTRRLVADHVAPAAPGARVVVWEDYDPAVVWYGDRPARIYTRSRSFFDLQQAIDMMRRADAVVLADDVALDALIRAPEPVIVLAPDARVDGLRDLIDRAGATRRVRLLRRPDLGRIVVLLEPPA